MNEKQIALLTLQVEKLEQRNFDLAQWKTFTESLLAGIFGDTSYKIKQIQAINYDFSSWALRDTSGNADFMVAAKKTARSILEAAILELELGIVKMETKTDSSVDAVKQALENYLTMGQFRALSQLSENNNYEESKRKAKELLHNLKEEALIDILSEIMAKMKF